MATSVHNWDDIRIFHKEARTLTSIGEVHLVGVDNPDSTPTELDGITLTRLPADGLRLQPGGKFLPRLKRIARISRIVLAGAYQVFHFHDPELIPVGWLAKLRGRRVIYDVHEDVGTMLLSRQGLPKWLGPVSGRLMRGLEYLSTLVFDRIILAATSIARTFNPKNARFVLNYPIVNQVPQPGRRADGEPLRLVYVGGLTTARGINELIDAVQALRNNGETLTLDLYGVIAEQQLKNRIQSISNSGWLTWHGWLPIAQLMDRLKDYHVGLSSIRDLPNYRYAWPTKVLDYLAAGLPVIASRLPGTEELLSGPDCVVYFEPGDSSSLQTAIQSLQDEKVRRRLAAKSAGAAADYSWESQAEALINVYHEILK